MPTIPAPMITVWARSRSMAPMLAEHAAEATSEVRMPQRPNGASPGVSRFAGEDSTISSGVLCTAGIDPSLPAWKSS